MRDVQIKPLHEQRIRHVIRYQVCKILFFFGMLADANLILLDDVSEPILIPSSGFRNIV